METTKQMNGTYNKLIIWRNSPKAKKRLVLEIKSLHISISRKGFLFRFKGKSFAVQFSPLKIRVR